MNRILITLLLAGLLGTAQAQSFTYRGSLEDSGEPAQGRYDLRLSLYADRLGTQVLAAPLELNDVAVTDGRFAVGLDFADLPAGIGTGWLEVAVQAGDEGSWETLEGRSEVLLDGLVCPTPWGLEGNAGTNAAINFLGTTDNQPLVLRSSAGIGINTAAIRGLLTLRGPDDYNLGPVIHMSGNTNNQSESGRIRFVDGSAVDNYRGMYIHYNGTAPQRLQIGAHAVNGNDPADDRNVITILRNSPNRVGIGNANPAESLDVIGNIALTGGIKFTPSTHFASYHGAAFSELAQATLAPNACDDRANGVAKIPFQANPCRAQHAVHLPQGAVVRRVYARVEDNMDAARCGVQLRSADLLSGDGTHASIATAFSTTAFAGGLTTIPSEIISHSVNNSQRALILRAFSDGDFCTVIGALIEYELPNGFKP